MGHLASAKRPRGRVAEWLKAADCKSAHASVRWFESSPFHHPPRRGGSVLPEKGTPALPTPLIFIAAAMLEIGGCFAFWKWARLGASPLWLIPGLVALAGFAWILTFADTPAAARGYAAYGGIYVASSLGWMWLVEGLRPDRFDLIGGALCLAGCLAILFGPR